ncbi:MAG TPA: hypothetical protein VIV11_09685 [Kofleriaceae bacterium]
MSARWLPLLLLAGCATEDSSLLIERQPTTIAQTSDTGWKRGSVILAGDAGIFTFPQPVSLRFTMVDDATLEMPTQLAITAPKLEPFGASSQLEVTIEPACDAMTCTAELSVTAMGSSVIAVQAKGPYGTERACFYYAVVDASTDTDALRTDLETQQQDCRINAE